MIKTQQENERKKPRLIKKINFKGLAIGDGLMDISVQNDYGSLLYSIGLIDSRAKAVFDAEREKFLALIGQEEWVKAFQVGIYIQEDHGGNLKGQSHEIYDLAFFALNRFVRLD